MSEIKVLNNEDYGFESNHWLLKVALSYVPQQQLHLALVAVIDKIVYSEDELEFLDILQLIAQVALTKRFVQTSDDAPTFAETRATHDYGHDAEPEIHATINTDEPDQDEIDRQIAEFTAFLEGIPTIKDEDRNTTKKEEDTQHD